MHGRKPQMEGLGNRLIGSSRRCTQQDVGTRDPARGGLTFVDHIEQVSLLVFGEVNQIFVGHRDSSYCPHHRVAIATCQNFCGSPLVVCHARF